MGERGREGRGGEGFCRTNQNMAATALLSMLNLFSSLDFSYVYHSPRDSLDEVLLSVSCVCLFVCLFVCLLILVMYIIRPVIASTRCCCQSPVFVSLFVCLLY